MKQQHTQHVTDVTAHVTLDQCRVAFMANINNHFLRLLMENDNLPNGMNRNVLRQTLDQNERCIREVKRTALPHNPHYLDSNVKKNKALDMATVIDAMARIGIENRPEIYEEFLGLMVDCIDAIFYAQQNRRKMHFGKYKALFKLFTDEMRADANDEPGQLLFTQDKELYFKVVKPATEHKIK